MRSKGKLVKYVTVSFFFSALISSQSQAEDWSVAYFGGLNHAGKTTASVHSGNVTSGPFDSDSTPATNFGVEFFSTAEKSPLGFAILAKASYFGNGSLPSDSNYGIYIGPRIQSRTKFNVWGEVLLGPSLTAIGTQTLSNISGTSIKYDSGTMFSIAYTPRVGVDYDTGSGYFMGISFGVLLVGGSNTFNTYNSSGIKTDSHSADFSGHVSETAIRFGYRLGQTEATPTPAP